MKWNTTEVSCAMNLTWHQNQWQVLEKSDDPKEAMRCSSATVFKHWTFTGVHIYLCNVLLPFRSHTSYSAVLVSIYQHLQ